MINFNFIWVDIKCPHCGYEGEVQLLDVKTEKTIFCHNCKIEIHINNPNATAHSTGEEIEQGFKDLENIFKKFGR